MAVNLIGLKVVLAEGKRPKHPKCEGYKTHEGDYDCGYNTTLMCEECKYGLGHKDPEANCNQPK